MSQVPIKCPKCGANEFEVKRKDLRKSDKLTCNKCGFSTAYENLMIPFAKKQIENALKKAFKK